MKPGAELNLQLLDRAYCYLRLSGLEPAAALEGTRASLEALTRSPDGREVETVWSRVEALSSQADDFSLSAPPLMRGHMVYPP
jgi:anaerobic glycerol-3-phosphate dehydrogenase